MQGLKCNCTNKYECSFFIFCWESFEGNDCFKSGTHRHHQNGASSFVMLWQAFNVADFSNCLFVGFSAFNFVFKWNAQSGWDQEIDLAIAEYSWVALAVCYGSSLICAMKHRLINFAPLDRIWAVGLVTETRYLCNRYVLEPNQNADFGASFWCHAWAIGLNICPLFLLNRRKKHIFIGTAREKLFPNWENAHELNSESSINTSPTNLCSIASVLFLHSNLKAQLGKWEHPRSVWMQ